MGSQGAVWSWLFRLYWRLALVPAVWLPVVLWSGGPAMVRATLLYWGALALARLLAWRFPEREGAAIAFHLGTAVFTATYTLVSPPQAVAPGLAPSEWRLAIGAFQTMGIYVLAAFAGWPGLAAGLGILLLAPWPNLESRLLLAASSVPALVAGVSVHWLIRRFQGLQALVQSEALTDALTGLANRRALERDFPSYQALAHREGLRLALSLWDLDGLKAVNDREGHAAGDAYLKRFARILREESREGDALYRLGGDEFVGLHLGLGDGASLEERVKRRFPGVSVGFAPAGSLPLAEVLATADRAMYQRKRPS